MRSLLSGAICTSVAGPRCASWSVTIASGYMNSTDELKQALE